jgi:hypothetical protein
MPIGRLLALIRALDGINDQPTCLALFAPAQLSFEKIIIG